LYTPKQVAKKPVVSEKSSLDVVTSDYVRLTSQWRHHNGVTTSHGDGQCMSLTPWKRRRWRRIIHLNKRRRRWMTGTPYRSHRPHCVL